jgi:MFS family permease
MVGKVTPNQQISPTGREAVESRYAWWRLTTALALGTVGSVGMWSVVVALPAVQADFGVARADASLPFTMTMVGFGGGGIVMGRLADRFGIVAPVLLGIVCLAVGYSVAAVAPTLLTYALVHLLIGFGSSATFGPLLADTSYWFVARRGIAVAIAASVYYLV